MKFNLKETTFILPKTETQIIYYAPWINLGLACNHIIGREVQCYIDTGAAVTVFPSEYAQVFLGFSLNSIKNGVYLPIQGAGSMMGEAWGHTCTLNFGGHSIKNSLVFFMEKQPHPLLGQYGFIDRLKGIKINMEDKFLDLEL